MSRPPRWLSRAAALSLLLFNISQCLAYQVLMQVSSELSTRLCLEVDLTKHNADPTRMKLGRSVPACMAPEEAETRTLTVSSSKAGKHGQCS